MKAEYVSARISEIQHKYKVNMDNAEEVIRNLQCSRTQIQKLSQNVQGFVQQVFDRHAELIQEADVEGSIDLLIGALNNLNKFISDQPSVIGFELEKMEVLVSTLSDFDSSHEMLKQQIADRELHLNRIKDELNKGKDPTKRKTVGKRVERVKDVRIAKEELEAAASVEEEQPKEKPAKKSRKKSAKKDGDKS
jgi:predicted O-linked N-acetylglucosamine transferase (SPINDLY family)